MKRKLLAGGVIGLVLATGLVVAAAKPDFSGAWVMDRGRSFGIPRDMDQTMNVTHAGDKIDLVIKIVTPQGERTVNDVYNLDGKEAEFTPQGPSGPGGKGRRTAKWLPNGNGIVVSEETTVDTPQGPVTSQLTRKWIMSADGNTLTIDFYHDGPQGSFETKRIFVRKTA